MGSASKLIPFSNLLKYTLAIFPLSSFLFVFSICLLALFNASCLLLSISAFLASVDEGVSTCSWLAGSLFLLTSVVAGMPVSAETGSLTFAIPASLEGLMTSVSLFSFLNF